MAKARAIIKRRKAVDNIRKITRTMELIATARFRKAMDRAVEAEAYTRKIAEMAADLGESSTSSHPLFERREPVKNTLLLVLTSNRGLAGGYNGNVLRAAMRDYQDLQAEGSAVDVEISGKRGLNFWKYRRLPSTAGYQQFEDKPAFGEVEALADRYLAMFLEGKIDRMDVAYTRFVNTARQEAVVKTLLPIQVDAEEAPARDGAAGAPPREDRLRVPAGRRGDPPGDRPGLVQGAALQVLPRRGGQRADRADGGHEGRLAERRRALQDPHPPVQPGPPVPDHRRPGRHRRGRDRPVLIPPPPAGRPSGPAPDIEEDPRVPGA